MIVFYQIADRLSPKKTIAPPHVPILQSNRIRDRKTVGVNLP